MTVPATTRKAGPFTGTGLQTVFPFAFKVFAISDVKVVQTDTAGTETTLSSGYTVTMNSDQVASPGGSVTLTTALPSGYLLSVLGNLPYDQTLALPGGGNFNPVAMENAFDRTVEQLQQLAEVFGRTLVLSPNTSSSVSPTVPVPAANKVLAWNAAGTALTLLNTTDIATVASAATTYVDTFTGNGATTAFTLSAAPLTINNLLVSISGVLQTPGVDYTYSSGTTLTFTTAPPNGTKVMVRQVQAVPSSTPFTGVEFSSVRVGNQTAGTVLSGYATLGRFAAVGGGMNNATGVFTAPSDGWYQFNATLQLVNITGATVTRLVALRSTGTSGTDIGTWQADIPNNGIGQVALSAVVGLNAGDTVYTEVGSALSGTLYTANAVFSGFKVAT